MKSLQEKLDSLPNDRGKKIRLEAKGLAKDNKEIDLALELVLEREKVAELEAVEPLAFDDIPDADVAQALLKRIEARIAAQPGERLSNLHLAKNYCREIMKLT